MIGFKKVNNLLGWTVFAIATWVYFLTLEPSASWWDCGEYIATAYKLQVGHPPGAPLFQLIGRFFSLFAFGNVAHVALMINIMSALSSSFTILFLFWTITLLGKKLAARNQKETNNISTDWAILGAGLVGSLAYTFSDSFWFSAVEGEVYAMSSFFTAVVFWAILRWEAVAEQPYAYRWLILIAYMVGLSIGVHLLNLLAIPAIAYVYYYKKYPYSLKGFIIAGLVSIAVLSFVMYMIIPWVVQFAGKFELFFVNSLGMPFNSGTIIYFSLIIGGIVWGLKYSRKKGKVALNTILLATVFILIGYSSFFMLIIRSNANPPINENAPKDAISLLSYLNREQYGSWPLLYGPYYNAPEIGRDNGTPVYIKDEKNGKYKINDDRIGTIPVYDERFNTLFPRMWSNRQNEHIRLYKQYGGNEGTPISVTKPDGSSEVLYRPTFGENLRFFFSYQLSHMYIRYFMWNFVGRQNDIESQGEINHGNWISGIGFIDAMRLGDQNHLPDSMKNPARATFYFLPLLLGLLGFLFHFKKSRKDTWVVFLLFFMTGIAIIIYLNQYPYQPRERDYAFAGSFYAFAIWIGLGVMALVDFAAKKFTNKIIPAVAISLICLLLVPGIMAAEGWQSHDRSGKYAARDFARMYLESCEPNAILFANGDNDTFPLWYAQEVEGIRTDVRVVNYMLSSGEWYTDQMFTKQYESEPLPLSIPKDFYHNGRNAQVLLIPRFDQYISLQEGLAFVASDDERTRYPLNDGRSFNYFPSRKVKLAVDSAAAVHSGTIKPEEAHKMVHELSWTIDQSGLIRNELMLLDLVATNNWERPIYFVNPHSVREVLPLSKYCHLEGMLFRLKPMEAVENIRGLGGVDVDRSYEVLMDEGARWGRLNEADVVVDRESARHVQDLMTKQNYRRLAIALINQQKNDSAVAVLDKALYFFPHEKFPYDIMMLSWADAYYRAGAPERGNDMVKKLLDRYRDDLRYYASLEEVWKPHYQNEIQEGINVLQSLAQITNQYKQPELNQEIEQVYAEQMGRFN